MSEKFTLSANEKVPDENLGETYSIDSVTISYRRNDRQVGFW